MNYELAKQLKDAGFPQTSKDGQWNLAPFVYGLEKDGETFINNGCHAPTLSELIEACGEGAFYLIKVPNPGRDWKAFNWQCLDSDAFRGSTPEEAVANLWLALNKK